MSAADPVAGPRVRGPYRNGIERRRQLVEAAWGIFARRGYARASLREIADAVGVSPAGILRLFGSKEDLLIAVLDRWDIETSLLSDRVELGEGPRFFDSFGALMRYHVEHPGLIELFLTLCTEATDPEHPATVWVQERYDRIVRDAVRQLAEVQTGAGVPVAAPERRELEVRWLFGAMDGLELQWIAEPGLDLVGHSDALFDRAMRRWTQRPVPAGGWPPKLPTAPVLRPDEPDVVPGATVRGPYRNGIERRRQIVVEATRVFGRRGYAGASLREIAGNVGVTAAALLRYFGSKEQLLFAVLDHWDDASESRGLLAQDTHGLGYFEALGRVMSRHGENPGLVELLLSLCAEASDPDHPAREWVRDRYRRIVAEAGRALEQAGRAGDVRAMEPAEVEFEVRVLFAVMDGLELQWIANPEIDLGATFAPFLAMTLERWRQVSTARRGPRAVRPHRS